LAAYDDSDGITAAFNLNILHRHLNREMGANFDAGPKPLYSPAATPASRDLAYDN
jgi:hypothetical protein